MKVFQGGFDGHIRQNTAERYSPNANQWLPIPSMHAQRSGLLFSAVIDYHN
jgi:hypothetical protein